MSKTLTFIAILIPFSTLAANKDKVAVSKRAPQAIEIFSSCASPTDVNRIQIVDGTLPSKENCPLDIYRMPDPKNAELLLHTTYVLHLQMVEVMLEGSTVQRAGTTCFYAGGVQYSDPKGITVSCRLK